MNFLVRNNAVWNSTAVGKVFCKPMNDSFGKSIKYRAGEIIPRTSSKSKQGQSILLHDRSGPWQVNLSWHCWLVTLREYCYIGGSVLCLATAISRSFLVSRYSYFWARKQPPFPIWGSLVNDRDVMVERVDHSLSLVIEFLLCWDQYFHSFCLAREVYLSLGQICFSLIIFFLFPTPCPLS